MKLLKCYIENFGILSDFEYNFNDKFNTIIEDNGFGKTTFSVFIKAMFYGLDSGANKKLLNSERKKYAPWQGGNYGGNVEFELNNKKYKIIRYFGNKQTDDTFELYDLDTKKKCNDFSENIGEDIFKISKDGFERSIFIPQGSIQINIEDSISAKLGNVLDGNDIDSFDFAIKNIENVKKEIQKSRGNGGLLNEKKAKLEELNREAENKKLDEKNLEIYKQNLKEIEKKLEDIKNERDKLNQTIKEKNEYEKKLAQRNEYNRLLDNYLKLKYSATEKASFFGDDIPTEQILNNLMQKNYELSEIDGKISNIKLTDIEQEKLNLFKKNFENKNITEDFIDTQIQKNSDLEHLQSVIDVNEKRLKELEGKENYYKIIFIILFICTITFFTLGIFTSFKFLLFIGLVFAIISGVIFYKKKKNNCSALINTVNEYKTRKNDVEEVINNLLETFNLSDDNKALALSNLKNDFKTYLQLIEKENEINQRLEKVQLQKNDLKIEITKILNKYYLGDNRSYADLIKNLGDRLNEYNLIIKQFKAVEEEKEKYELTNDIEEIKKFVEIDANLSEEFLQEELKKSNEKIDELNDSKNKLKNALELLILKINDNEYIENDIINLKDEISNLEEKYNLLDKAEELLTKAKDNFSSKYLSNMVTGFTNYMKLIDNKNLEVAIDTELNTAVKVGGKNKETQFMSVGYQDLIYVCVRLALIDALFINEKPFIILDDPFVNLDDEKTKRALSIINEISNKYQIIYLVCNTSRISK